MGDDNATPHAAQLTAHTFVGENLILIIPAKPVPRNENAGHQTAPSPQERARRQGKAYGVVWKSVRRTRSPRHLRVGVATPSQSSSSTLELEGHLLAWSFTMTPSLFLRMSWPMMSPLSATEMNSGVPYVSLQQL